MKRAETLTAGLKLALSAKKMKASERHPRP